MLNRVLVVVNVGVIFEVRGYGMRVAAVLRRRDRVVLLFELLVRCVVRHDYHSFLSALFLGQLLHLVEMTCAQVALASRSTSDGRLAGVRFAQRQCLRFRA